MADAISSCSEEEEEVRWRLKGDEEENNRATAIVTTQQLEDEHREQEAMIAIVTTDEATTTSGGDALREDDDDSLEDDSDDLHDQQHHHLVAFASSPPASPQHSREVNIGIGSVISTPPRSRGPGLDPPGAASPPPSPPRHDNSTQQQHVDAAAFVTPESHSNIQLNDSEEEEEYADAMAHAAEASHFLQMQDYDRALQAYQSATEAYQQTDHAAEDSFVVTHHPSLLAICNAAACWRNIGGIHRHLQDYDLAAAAWQEAEALYWSGLEQQQHQGDDDDGESAIHPVDPQQGGVTFCLDALWMETLQARAALHYRFHQDAAKAMACHEQVVSRLLQLEHPDRFMSKLSRQGHVSFVALGQEQHTRLLLVSLESLATLYRRQRHTAEEEETDNDDDQDLQLFHDALYLIRQRYEQKARGSNSEGASSSNGDQQQPQHGDGKSTGSDENNNNVTDRLLDSMTNLLRILSDLYYKRGNIDRAVDALHDVMDIKLSREEFPPEEAIETMDKMGQANEKMEQYDKALQCYEKALLARSRYLGPDHINVAKSLINVARVMELQGNTDGSMDLYRAAQGIYARQVTSQSFAVEGEDARAILRLIPAILEQGRYIEAVAYLNKCLEAADDEAHAAATNDNDPQRPALDKSQIYYDLGRAYVGLEDYMPATICLVEAAKIKDGNVTQEQVLKLWKHVELLQQQAASTATPSGSEDGSSVGSSDDDSARPYGEAQFMRMVGQHPDVVREPLETSLVPVPPKDSMSPYKENVSDHHAGRGGGRMSHPPKGSTTPVTWEELSGCDSKTGREGEKSETFESSDDEEATAYYDSGPEAGNSRIPRSDVSSSDEDDDVHSAHSHSPPISIDPVPVDEDAEHRSSALEKSTITTSSPTSSRARRAVPFAEKFRRRRKDGFESLLDEEQTTTDQEESAPLSVPQQQRGLLPAEDDFHTLATFDGPVEYIDMRSPSWESGISQITLRFDDPMNRKQQQSNQQEWWWGVTSNGFGRWFPSTVSKAVQAAEGFLSAEAIHAKKKQQAPSPSVFVLSDEEEEELEEGEASGDEGSVEGVDHLSNIGIATSKATRPIFTTRPMLQKSKSGDSPHHDSVFSSPSPLRSPTAPGNFSMEIAQCQQRLREEESERGKTHPDFATALFTLAVLHSRDQNVTSAVEAATEALQIQKDNGSTEDAIRSLHFLADLQLHQRNFKASLTYYAEALKMESSRYGYYSDATAKTLNCIGAARSMQNEFALAMASHQEALNILKESHGEDPRHPLVLDTLCEIGSVYYRERNSFSTIKAKKDGFSTFIEGGMLEVIGRAHEERGSYKMAIAFFEEKLQFLENRGQDPREETAVALDSFEMLCDRRGRGEDALEETAVTLNSLGMLCTRAGLFVEALDYYERALSLQLQVGCDEVDVATARVLTAAVHHQLGRWPQALALLEDALNVLQREIGDDQPTVAATLFQLGVVRSALCEHEMAMVALKRALTLQAELLGDDHPATLRTNREIGKMYTVYDTELNSAFEIFNDVLEAQKIVHGDRHPNIADTLHYVGAAYARKNDFPNALRVLEESYYMRLEFLGWDHPLQATTLHEIANIHLVRGRLNKASHICDVVLRIRTEGLGDKHIDVARTLLTKGCCLTAKGDFDGAAQCFKASLAMVVDLVGDNHPLVADVRIEMGVLHLRKCQFDEARGEIQSGLDIYNSKLDKDHPSIVKAEQKLEQVEHHEMLCV